MKITREELNEAAQALDELTKLAESIEDPFTVNAIAQPVKELFHKLATQVE